MRRCCCYRYDSEMNITYYDLQKLLQEDKVIIVDVRSKQEFAEGHIDSAINIPLGEISKISSSINNYKSNIVVYCTSGIRSKKAQKILKSMGYEKVYNLVDGI